MIDKMNADQEYMITLSRLQLPDDSNVQRVTLSLSSPLTQEQFIHNQKIVKKNRVNFYRQTLFLPSVASGLFFKVYQIDEHNEQQLLKAFWYGGEELSSVARHAAMFHAEAEGFELVWECSVFNAEESDVNEETDKEYTELRGNMGAEDDDTQMSDIFIESHSNLDNAQQASRNTDANFKKSNSTDDTFLAKTPEERNWRMEEDFMMQPASGGEHKAKKIESEAGKEKKRVHIKSHIYSQLITEISGLFSGMRA